MTDSPPDHPGVIVFPPLLFAGTLAVALVLQWLFPIRLLPPLVARPAGGVLLVASLSLARWGQVTMHRAGTNVHPTKPTLAIVSDGPFRLTRNPLYLALSGAYLGITLLADTAWPLIFIIPVLLVAHFGIVRREERYLEGKFGDAYLAYKARVRRWI
ncbi:MAG TPA: isoprenylcysteine carboxylmethyltransferase family protein [Gemmatimonadales bacterium]|nr:isoprenylcysteine carboxylmethyltransferase family protein [Gemmatimonadales bacterium]